jgi:hypothetical protein
MRQIPSPHYFCVKFLASHLIFLCSSLILLGQASPARSQITPNGAGTVVNPQGNQINITGGTQAGANFFHNEITLASLFQNSVAEIAANPESSSQVSVASLGNFPTVTTLTSAEVSARVGGLESSFQNDFDQYLGRNSNSSQQNSASADRPTDFTNSNSQSNTQNSNQPTNPTNSSPSINFGNLDQQLQVTSTKSEALRQAQLAMLRGEVRLEDGNLVTPDGRIPLTEELKELGNLRLNHPYYWSAFTLVAYQS